MQFKEISGEVKIPVFGIGTWKMGGGIEVDTTYDKGNIFVIKTAIKVGMTQTSSLISKAMK